MGRLPLVVATACTAAGIALGLLRPVPGWGGPLLVPAALAGAAVAAALLWAGRHAPSAPSGPSGPSAGRMALALLTVAGALLGGATRLASDRSCLRWVPDGVPVRIAGRVASVSGDRLAIRADTVWVGGAGVACGAEIPGRGAEGPAPAPGSDVTALGRWWSPPGRPPPLGRAGTFLIDSVTVRAGPGPDAGEPVAHRLRSAAGARVDALFGDRAPLVASLILAQRDGLDRDVRDRFARAGLSHLLAISGLHVGLVAGILLLLASLLRLGRRAGPVVAAAGTLLYVAFLGAPHSAVRAALQIVLLLAGRMLQRPTRSASLVAAAALAILVADPGALLAPGFQLSFAGVAGILVLRPPLLAGLAPLARVRVARARPGQWLADGLATSLAATAATAPIVAWHFGRLAPIGVLANLVAIPLLGLAIPALAAALLAAPVWPAGGRFLAAPGVLLIDALDRTASAAAAIPWGTAPVTGPAAGWATAAVVAGWLVTRRLGRVRRSVRAAVWVGVGACVLLVAPLRPAGDRVELHMIDVGQGDAIALRSPAGRWLLVDAGIGGLDYDAGARRVVPYLARRGARRLEGLILTHPDADHTGGAASVIRALRPRWVGDPGVAAGKAGYLELLETAAGARVAWVGLARGVAFELDGVAVEILAPDGVGAAVEDANDASVVARVRYGEFAALLTGDAPAAVERRLAGRYGRALDVDVLKVGHHGSATSTTPELLTATGARLALVSAGRGNRYGHPHPAVVRRLLDRGVRVLRSDRNGSVVVRGDRSGVLSVEMDRGAPGARGVLDASGAPGAVGAVDGGGGS